MVLGFASSSTRTPHGAYVRVGGRNRIDPHWFGLELLVMRACTIGGARAFGPVQLVAELVTEHLRGQRQNNKTRIQSDGPI